jgi:HD superfamily phosphohydrolase
MASNKRKIFNDPIYGFIGVPSELIFDIIETPEFQRLRRIRQMGLADMVYPGALHTRFHHALGCMHLMQRTLENLRDKGTSISNDEYEAAQIAILLHDVGHGPFSHTLEYSLISNVDHEELSLLIMKRLNGQFDGGLNLAIQMFDGSYERPFFHQLISSQLDIDRLDYLNRDSFFTGVSEGTIGADRIIKLLDVVDEEIVVEEKGIYSIENFLNARRLMYWQVYLHKTGVAADIMLQDIISRAKELSLTVPIMGSTPVFTEFLTHNYSIEDFLNPSVMDGFIQLDDFDVWTSIKLWTNHDDPILAFLSRSLLNRHLFKIMLSNEPLDQEKSKISSSLMKDFNLSEKDLTYFVKTGSISNAAYMASNQKIKILKKDKTIVDIEDTTDLPNIKAISKIVTKYYLCWAKNVSLSKMQIHGI